MGRREHSAGKMHFPRCITDTAQTFHSRANPCSLIYFGLRRKLRRQDEMHSSDCAVARAISRRNARENGERRRTPPDDSVSVMSGAEMGDAAMAASSEGNARHGPAWPSERRHSPRRGAARACTGELGCGLGVRASPSSPHGSRPHAPAARSAVCLAVRPVAGRGPRLRLRGARARYSVCTPQRLTLTRSSASNTPCSTTSPIAITAARPANTRSV
ncbi:Uncharacterised protein [Burkholderia pseudomallei]|nr:hypothetical protein AQ15_3329 [Burkholderia pseudomallei K96243]CAJ3247982.1 Uncharacterised protein [Burkholderia pseudomallei]CAJ3320001.1 Uncharacterised protein [Burkholderia pseudomallei]CAJ3325783.1 Uncharacterised protein [Burkholderia pseudomallei]CAJ3331151.1 Uncharacterised protein [Burkholderia pseudomallei]